MKKGFDYTGVSLVFLCHDGQGNILFAKRSDQCRDEHHTWDVGGGGLRFGERVEDGLRREVKEEYGVDIKDFEFLGIRDVHRIHNGNQTHWIALDYKVHIDRENVAIGEPHKIEEIQWYTIDNVPDPLHSQMPNIINLYKDKI